MALDGTYTGLKASIADFLNRDDLTAVIPDFITLAEGQMARRFVGRQRQGLPIPRRLILRSDASFALADEYVAVPSDFMGPISFILTDSAGNNTELDYLDGENLQRLKTSGWLGSWYNGGLVRPPTGTPRYYTVVGSEFQIIPVADKAYTGELTYIKRLAAASGATNFILTDYPDAYLYWALVQSAPYLQADSRITVWGTLFTAALDDICNADPMPSDKSTLRSETACLTRPWRAGYYNINTDS